MTSWLLSVTKTCLILLDHRSHLFKTENTQLHEPLAPPNWNTPLYFVYQRLSANGAEPFLSRRRLQLTRREQHEPAAWGLNASQGRDTWDEQRQVGRSHVPSSFNQARLCFRDQQTWRTTGLITLVIRTSPRRPATGLLIEPTRCWFIWVSYSPLRIERSLILAKHLLINENKVVCWLCKTGMFWRLCPRSVRS